MPLYEYKCSDGCDSNTVSMRPVDMRDSLAVCDVCGANARRVPQTPRVWAPTRGAQ